MNFKMTENSFVWYSGVLLVVINGTVTSVGIANIGTTDIRIYCHCKMPIHLINKQIRGAESVLRS